MHAQHNKPPTTLVFWIIWIAIFQGLFMITFFAGGGLPAGEDAEGVSAPMLSVAFVLLGLSIFVRWLVLPRAKTAQTLLTSMIIGVALAEASMIIGVFVIGDDFPGTKRALFYCALLGVGQYIPFYAAKYSGR